MKILVTGGAGFIGSHIVDSYINLGHDVAVVDNLSTGFRRNLNGAARFYQLGIEENGLAAVFDEEKPDIVNHQAAQIDVRKSSEDPVHDATVNILGSLNVLANCVRANVSRFIYASSGGAVYGDVNYLPADEAHPINPISQYGVSKHTVEHYIQLYSTLHGLKYVILRYGNVYGPRQNPFGEAGVVAIFAIQMLTGKQPVIFGPGNKTRDYVHVSDVAAANVHALEHGDDCILNIGTGRETSDQEIFDTLADTLSYPSSPSYAPVRKGEVYRICLECSKAREQLGWVSRLSLKEGIALAADYYRKLAEQAL
ncbi:MAG: NAD-dependent epimerase/dehydratase family protein [Dehalococcoidia bacterium]|nr:NAD-dependent epimerase/dehydratase family protein [Dehalococcoidia bacterium]